MKTIKLTNEMAVELYNKDPELRTTLLHEFTDEELGIKPKPLRWEDLGAIEGCYIDSDSTINKTDWVYYAQKFNRNFYPCVKDAEKALAHCQLLQLAKHYNKCDQHEIKSFYYIAKYNTESENIRGFGLIGENVYGGQVKFINETDLNKCIEDNRDLWEIYLGVK
jgi:hypothetical protein